jgi:hypothetical protein
MVLKKNWRYPACWLASSFSLAVLKNIVCYDADINAVCAALVKKAVCIHVAPAVDQPALVF